MRNFFVLLLSVMLLFSVGCSDDDAAATYTVTYAANGADSGVIPVDSGAYAAGVTVTVLSNSGNLVKTGSTFAGWNSAADGNGIDYAVGGVLTMPATNMMLYAKWFSDRAMVTVPGGTFIQTDTNANSFTHTISGFQMGKYEVTYNLWHTVYSWATNNDYTFANAGREGHDGAEGSVPTTAKFEPVTRINWRDAIVWCNAYSEMSGYSPVYCSDSGYTTAIKDSSDGSYGSSINTTAGSFDNPYVNWSANGFRLPTEGEWQYAASYQDGSSWTPYDYASGATADYNNATETGTVAWYSANSGSTTHDVGTKTANQLGIHDMSGNVWEWCWDWYGSWPTAAQSGYTGPASGGDRVLRGGYWYNSANYLRVGYRYLSFPYTESYGYGFRVARKP